MKKLSDYAKEMGVTYQTAYNHFKRGLIDDAYQLANGTIVLRDRTNHTKKKPYIVTYARVSSSENRTNLETQSKRLIDFCNANGWQTHENVAEIGSGLNDNRSKLNKLLESRKPTKLIIEHKDRLTRFGFNYISILCKHIECELYIINNVADDKEDLVQDFTSIITSFCARIYGQRRTKRKTEQLIKELKQDPPIEE